MGKLALWGAVAGGAEEVKENIKEQQAAAAEAEKASIDHAREMAMERLRQRGQKDVVGMQQEGATQRTGMQIEGQRDVQELAGSQAMERVEAEGGIRTELQDDEQAFQAEQAQLDRESSERIARYTSGVSSAAAKAARERFKPKVLTVTEANEQFPQLQVEQDTPAIYDEFSATWYLQQGDRYIPAGRESGQVARAPQKAIEHLFKNPQLATEFVKPRDQGGYGYLPLGFMQVLRQYDMQGATSNQE